MLTALFEKFVFLQTFLLTRENTLINKIILLLANHIKLSAAWLEWLKCWARNQHGLGSKSIRAILLCSWERHFTVHSPAWWSWQAVLNYSHISIKLQVDSNILASPEVGQSNCLLYVLAPPLLSCESGG